jgi:cytochrome c peroxidase
MKRMVKGTVFTLLICIGLSACGEQDKVMAPDKLPQETEAQEQGSDSTPEELLASIRNHTTLVPISDMPIPEDNPMNKPVLPE